MKYSIEFWFSAVAFLLVSALVLSVYMLYRESEEWDRFKIERNCVEVASIKGNLFNVIAPNSAGGLSVGIGATPDKTGWKCDDGKTYFR